MINFLREKIKPKYESLNNVYIIKKNIIFNYGLLKQQQPDAEIFPVLKSNAYGHGLKEMCQILNDTDAPMLAIDSFPEAQIVYKNSNKKVLIIGEMALGSYKHCNLKRTEFCVYNKKTLKLLGELKKKVKIHVFVNTGMNREGVKDLRDFLKEIKKYKNIEIVGLCSHLASAENNPDFNKEQEGKFIKQLKILNKEGINPKWVHLGNSAGVYSLKNPKLTAFRVGIALYGYNILPEKHQKFQEANQLKPALRVTSKITCVQELKPGDKVSYNETFEASEDLNIATIPFGYYEGLDRRFSSKAELMIGNYTVKIAGRICMNITCLDCDSIEPQIGDKVTVISEKITDPNSVQNLANIINIIPYEILTSLRENIRRQII